MQSETECRGGSYLVLRYLTYFQCNSAQEIYLRWTQDIEVLVHAQCLVHEGRMKGPIHVQQRHVAEMMPWSIGTSPSARWTSHLRAHLPVSQHSAYCGALYDGTIAGDLSVAFTRALSRMGERVRRQPPGFDTATPRYFTEPSGARTGLQVDVTEGLDLIALRLLPPVHFTESVVS